MPASNSIGIRLLEAPTNRQSDPRAQIYIVDHVSPGATIQRKIQVSNGTTSTQHVKLYGGAATVEPSGWTASGGAGGNELAGWIAAAPAQVDVPAGGVADTTVSIIVPSDASSGERYAVVWAQPPATAGQGVSLVNLVGIRVLPFGGAGRRARI